MGVWPRLVALLAICGLRFVVVCLCLVGGLVIGWLCCFGVIRFGFADCVSWFGFGFGF